MDYDTKGGDATGERRPNASARLTVGVGQTDHNAQGAHMTAKWVEVACPECGQTVRLLQLMDETKRPRLCGACLTKRRLARLAASEIMMQETRR